MYKRRRIKEIREELGNMMKIQQHIPYMLQNMVQNITEAVADIYGIVVMQ